MKKRILALLLTVVMLLSMLPTQAFAAQTETATTEQSQQSTQSQQTPESTETQETEKAPVKTTQTIGSREELLTAIDYDAAMADLAYLTQTIGTRPAGSIGEEMAAEYVAAEFKKLGYETTIQEVPISKSWYWPGTAGEVYMGDLTLSAYTPLRNDYYTAFGPAEGTAVYLADPADVASLGSDLSDKIVFFPGNWRDKNATTMNCIKALDAAGAEAIVVLLDLNLIAGEEDQKTVYELTLDANTAVSVPLLLCNAYEAQRVPAYLAENPNIQVNVDCRDSGLHSHNAIGVKKAAVETDWTLYVCGHLDSVMPGSGTNDNASGTVGVLAMARAFQNVETNYNIVFVAVGAEEIGLIGSKYFAQSLTAEEIDHAIGVYNMDMIATSYPGCDYIYMMVPTGDFSLTDNVVENRVVLSTFRAAEELDYDKVVAKKEWASDHSSFNDVGIPAVGFILSSSATSLQDEPVYHTIKDDMTNFDPVRFERSLKLVTTAVYNDATAEFVAYVGEGKNREYYTTLDEAYAVASAKGTFAVPMVAEEDEPENIVDYPQLDDDADRFLATLNYKAMIADLEYLTKTLGDRVAGTQDERDAQNYVLGIFQALGYETKLQEFNTRSNGVSTNAIGVKKAAVETDLTIYISAHIDSVLNAPGANDNGSGVVGMLGLARALAKVETNYNIVFVSTGAEETGKEGSAAFANSLTAEQRANAICDYNLDMIATSQEDVTYIMMMTSDGKENHASLAAREAALSLGYSDEQFHTCQGTPADHDNFHKAGIPAVQFFRLKNNTGFSYDAVESNYHKPSDNMNDNFSDVRLKEIMDAVALAVYNDATADYVAVVGEGTSREYYTTVAEAMSASIASGGQVTLLSTGEVLNYSHNCKLSDGSTLTVNKALIASMVQGNQTVTLESGHYFLAEDVTTNVTFEIKGAVTLCLNGYTIDFALSSDSNGQNGGFYVNGGSLNIVDLCSNGAGLITASTSSLAENMSPIRVAGGALSLNKVTVLDNTCAGLAVLGSTCNVLLTHSNVSGGQYGIVNKGIMTINGGNVDGTVYGIKNEGTLSVENCYVGYGRTAVRYEEGEVVFMPFLEGTTAADISLWGTINGCNGTTIDTNRGVMYGTITKADPYIPMYYNKGVDLNYKIKSGDILEMRQMTYGLNQANLTRVESFWVTSSNSNYAAGYGREADMTHNTGTYQTVVYTDYKPSGELVGATLKKIRLDPVAIHDITLTGSFEYDYVYFGPKDRSPANIMAKVDKADCGVYNAQGSTFNLGSYVEIYGSETDIYLGKGVVVTTNGSLMLPEDGTISVQTEANPDSGAIRLTSGWPADRDVSVINYIPSGNVTVDYSVTKIGADVYVLSTESVSHKHCVYGENCEFLKAGTDCTHSIVSYSTPLYSGNFATGINSSGRYYLDEDVTLTDTLIIQGGGEVYLCLNGHSIYGKQHMSIAGGTTVYLCNCTENGENDACIYLNRLSFGMHPEIENKRLGKGNLYFYSGTISTSNSYGANVAEASTIVIDGGTMIADPGTILDGEGVIYPSDIGGGDVVIFKSGYIENKGEGSAILNYGFGKIVLDGDIDLKGGSRSGDIQLFCYGSYKPKVVIGENFAPSNGKVYTVHFMNGTIGSHGKHQLTEGWGQNGSDLGYIPFESVDGYEIVELEENGTKELYLIREEDYDWFMPHYHTLDNGEVIYFDQKLTQEVWNSCGGYVPAGNYILCESISGEPGNFDSFGYGGPHAGTTSYICLCGFDITTAERLHMYSGSTLHFVDCTEDPEKVGKFTVGHISCGEPATVILENIKAEFNATNWGIGADNKLIMKNCQTTYSGTSCGIGGAAAGWTAEIDGGTFTSPSGPCFDLDSVGKFTVGGSLIVNSGEKADFIVYSNSCIAFDANNPLTPPAGETYVIQLDGSAPTEDAPVRITDGWKNSGLASTATSEAKIPFVSNQGYVIRELTVNGVTELYVTLVEITAQVNDTTMGQVTVTPDVASAGTTVTVTATAKGDYGLNTVSYTYLNGTETVTKMVTMAARDADGNYVGTFTLPNTTGDVTVYAVFGTPHVHKLANGETITFERAITKEILEAYNYSLPAGNYYLAEDIALEKGLDLGSKHVCLNDHALTGYKDVNVSYSTVYDCKGSGVIETSTKVASNFYFKGGTIYSNCANGLYVQNGVQSFEGGTFIGSPDSGSTTTYGGGTVDNGKDIRLIGGKIVNTSGLGAVAHIGLGTVTLDGDFEMESATGANFYIVQAYNKSTALLTIGPNFAPNGKVYTVKYDASIASRTKRQLTSGWGANASDLGYIPFESVDGFEIVELEENGTKELYLIRPEDHTWFVPHYHTLDNGEVIYYDQKLTQEIWTANGYGTTIPAGNYVLCDDIVLGGSTYFQGYTATNANVNICLCGHYFGAEGVEWNFGTNSYIRVDDCTTDDTMLGTFAFGQIWATSNTNATIVFANGNFTSYGSRSWSMASYGDFHMEGGYFTSSANSIGFGPIRSKDNTYYIAGGTIICTGAAVADLDVKAVYFSGSPIVTGKGYDFEFYAHGLFTFVEGKPLTPPEGETYILHTGASVTADKPVQLTKDWKYSGLASTATTEAKIPFVSNQGYVVKEMTVNGVTELYLAVPEVTVAPNITGGTVSVNPTGGLKDTTITVTATPNQGKALRYVTYSYISNGETVTRLVETTMNDSGAYVGTFAMPNADVIVTAYFGDPHTHDGHTYTTLASTGETRDIYSILAEGGAYVLDGDGDFRIGSNGATLGKEVHLCLNGHTLKASQFYANEKVTICDCTGEGKLWLDSSYNWIWFNTAKSDVSIKDVEILDSGSQPYLFAIFVSGSKLSIENCALTSTNSVGISAVGNFGMDVTIKDSTLHHKGTGPSVPVEINGYKLSGYNVITTDNAADFRLYHENATDVTLGLAPDFDPAPEGKTPQTYTISLKDKARAALANGPVQLTTGWSVAKETNNIDYIPFVYYDETNKNAPFASDYIVYEQGDELYVGLKRNITVETEGQGTASDAMDTFGNAVTYTGEGATLKIEATPAEGHFTGRLVLTYMDGENQVSTEIYPDANGDFSFAMPGADVTAKVYFYGDHIHCKYGNNCEYLLANQECTHDKINFNIPLTQALLNNYSGDNYPIPTGNYFLVEDSITSPGKLTASSANVNICLCGKAMTVPDQFYLLNSKVTISDCTGNGSITTTSYFYPHGSSAHLTIASGNVYANVNKSGLSPAALLMNGNPSFTIEGGTLTTPQKLVDYMDWGSHKFYLKGGTIYGASEVGFMTEGSGSSRAGTIYLSGSPVFRTDSTNLVTTGNPFTFESNQPLVPNGEIYTFKIGTIPSASNPQVQFTYGWQHSGLSSKDRESALIPFVNVDGYAVREINGELYLVIPELTVEVNDPAMGSASADVLSGVKGTPVTVTATPVSDKYYVSSVVLTYWNGAETVAEEISFTTDENGVAAANLTMPAADAKVTVNFKKYHIHTMSTDCTVSENNADNIIFATELNQDNIESYIGDISRELQPGYYVLTEDVSTSLIYTPADTYICLNGYTLTFTHEKVGFQPNSGTLYVCDCSVGKTGTVYKESTNVYSCPVAVHTGMAKIYGGNYPSNGANGLSNNHGSLYFYDGVVFGESAGISQAYGGLTEVTGGIITSDGMGIEYYAGEFRLSGNPIINGKSEDIYLYNGRIITISGLLTPPDGETYSVRLDKNATKPTVGHPIQITQGFAENGNTYNCFTSANPNYFTYVKNGEVYLGVKANITVQTEGEGTAVAKDANGNVISVALETDTVKIDATPAEGYAVAKVVLSYMEGETEVRKLVYVDDDGMYGFDMPSAAVTVTVTFREKHIHTLADGRTIEYDTFVDQEVWNAIRGSVPEGNYVLVEDVSGHCSLKSNSYINICLCGYDVNATGSETQLYTGTTLRIDDCTPDDELLGTISMPQVYAHGAGHIIIADGIYHGYGSIASFALYGGSFTIEGGYFISDASRGMAMGSQKAGMSDFYFRGGSLTCNTGMVLEGDCGEIVLGGDLVITGKNMDIRFYPGYHISFEKNNPLNPPAGETYVIQLASGSVTAEQPVQLTSGWADSGLASTATTEAKIPFVSNQGYAVREITDENGVTELYLVVPELTVEVNDPTKGSVEPANASGLGGTSVVITATPATEEQIVYSAVLTYWDGAKTVTQKLPYTQNDDGNFVVDMTMPAADCTVTVNFMDKHKHPMSVDCETGDIVEFDKILDEDISELPEGNYVLTDDISVTSDLTINGRVNLCLNGHKMTFGTQSTTAKITVNGVLNICDCSEHETGTMNPDTITNNSGAYFRIYGGTVTTAVTTYGYMLVAGGALVGKSNTTAVSFKSGELVITGGLVKSGGTYCVFNSDSYSGTRILRISGGTIEANMYPIYVGNTEFHFGGAPVLNSKKNSVHIYLAKKNQTIIVDKAITGGPYTVYGTTNYFDGSEPYQITENWEEHMTMPIPFVSGKPSERAVAILKRDGKIELYFVAPHEHAIDNRVSGKVSFTPINYAGKTLESGSYVLYEDVTADQTLTINGDVKLCLNGHTLDMASNHIYVTYGSTLTICDCSEGKTGTITGSPESHSIATNPYLLENSGTVRLYSGNITSDQRVLYNVGNYEQYDGTLTSTHTEYAIDNGNTGYMKLVDGTVSGVKAIHNNYGEIEIKGGSVTATQFPFVVDGGKLTITGGEIKATGASGASIVAKLGAEVTLTGGKIINENTTGGHAIRLEGCTFKLSGRPEISAYYADFNLNAVGQTITVAGEITGTYSVRVHESVSDENPFQVTTGWTDIQPYPNTFKFESYSSAYYIFKHRVDGELYMVVPHKHTIVSDTDTTIKGEENVFFNSLLDSEATLATYLVEVNDQQQYALPSGSYVLTKDLTSDKYINIHGDVTLCLNGHTLTLGENAITFNTDGNLTICDCKGGGVITSDNYKATIATSYGTLNIYGGKVVNTQVDDPNNRVVEDDVTIVPSAIRCNSKLNVYGGEIVGQQHGVYTLSSKDAQVTVKAGKISAIDGDGIYASGANFVEICGEKAEITGHVAVTAVNANVTVSAGTLTGSSNGIYLSNLTGAEPNVTVSGTAVVKGKYSAIAVKKGVLNLKDAPIIASTQTKNPGISLATGLKINILGELTGNYTVSTEQVPTEAVPVQITTGWMDHNSTVTDYPFVHYNDPENIRVWKLRENADAPYELYFAVVHKHEIKDENGNVIDTIVYDKPLTQESWNEYYCSDTGSQASSYLNGGNYVLVEDVHADYFIQGKDRPGVNICLCGNNLTVDDQVSIHTKQYVSIVDCTEDQDQIGTLTATYLYADPCDLYMENIKVNLVGPGFSAANFGVVVGGTVLMKDVYLTCSGSDYGFVMGTHHPDVRLIGGSFTFTGGYAIDLDSYASFVMGGDLVITGKDDLDIVIYDNAYISFDTEYPLTPPAGETYTVHSEASVTVDHPVRITSGWATSGLTEIPFVSYDGYAVEELFCEATGMKELYLVMPTVTTVVETEGTGELVADPTAALGGTTVTLTATPAEGYMVEKVVLTYVLNGEEVTETLAVVAGEATFTMPAAHVTATATFRPLHIHKDGMVFDIVFTEELFAYYNGNIPAGNYVVMDSLTMGELRFNKGGEVNFCLCGQEVYNAETIACGGTRANIYDCIGTATWSSSKFAVDSTNGSGAQFYFYGGTLTGRTNTYGGGGGFTVRDSRGRMVVDGATLIGAAGYWATISVGDYNNGSYKGTITFVSGKIIAKGGDGTVELDKLNGRVEMEGSFILDCEKDGPEINLWGDGPLLTITGPMDPPVIDGVRETYTLTSNDKKPTWTAPVQFTEGWGNYDHGGYIPFVSYQGYAVREIETTYTNSYGETVTLKELFLCYVAEQTVDLNLWKKKEITVSAETMIEGIIACDPNHRFFADNGDYTVTGIQNHTMPVLSVEATEEGFLLNGSEVGTFTGDLVITYTDNGNGKTGIIIVPTIVNIYDVQDSIFVLDYAKDIKLTDHLFDADTLPGVGEDGNMILNVESYANNVAAINENGTFLAVEASDGEGTYGTFIINEDGEAIYDLDESVIMDAADKIKVVFRAVENGAEASELGIMNPFKEVEMFKEIVVIPANVVYYEDTHEAINWNPQSNAGIVINTVGTPTGSGYQDGDNSSEYGNDSDYTYLPDNYQGSGGTSKVITVKASGPVLTFTFKGTGFELLGRTTAKSGQFMYKIFEGTDIENKNSMVAMGAVDTGYNQWDSATPDGDDAIYEVPLLHAKDLDYGTYTVLIQAVANYDWYAPMDKWVNGLPPVEEITLYFDGVRVYNPIAMDSADRKYYIDGEKTASFVHVRDLILNGQAASAKFDENKKFSYGSGLVSYVENARNGMEYDGNKVTSLNDYLLAGPNNEVYFNETTQSLVLFVKETGAETALLQIGIRNLNPEAFDMKENDTTVAPEIVLLGEGGKAIKTLATAENAIGYTEQYYTINYKDCVVDTLNGETYYRVVITAKNSHAFSISNLKYSGLEFYTIPDSSATLRYDENGNLIDTTETAMPSLYKVARQIMAACNMLPEDELPGEDGDLKFRSISLSLQSSIGMNFYVAKDTLEGYIDPYIELTKVVYDKEGNASTIRVKLTDYQEVLVQGKECLVFIYSDIAAKEMNSAVNATLYAYKADTIQLKVGESRDYSVVQYARNMLSRNLDEKLNTLLVDMVNYGAQAQIYFGYNTANLANVGFEEYQSYATVEQPEMVSNAIMDAENNMAPLPEGATDYVLNITGLSLVLEDRVKVNVILSAKDVEDANGNLIEGRVVKVYYVTELGNTVVETLPVTAETRDSNGKYYRMTFDSLNASDMRTSFTAWVEDAEGYRISNTVSYSIESYCASMMAGTTAAHKKLQPLVVELMKYGDSALAYFGGTQ